MPEQTHTSPHICRIPTTLTSSLCSKDSTIRTAPARLLVLLGAQPGSRIQHTDVQLLCSLDDGLALLRGHSLGDEGGVGPGGRETPRTQWNVMK